jgi:hypothetical protein
MTPRQNPTPRATPRGPGTAANRTRIVSDPWNEEILGVLRRAAESRADRDRVRNVEDARATEREASALMALIDGHKAAGGR